MTPPPASPTPPRRTSAGARTVPVVALLVLVEFCSGILQGGFPILLPHLRDSLHLGAGTVSLALGVEFLVSGVALPVTSRLGDLHGHRLWLRITVALTLAGYLLSAAAAVAGSLPLLLLGRALAGFLSCWLPLEFAIIRDRMGERRGGRAVGLLVGSLTLGSTLGALVVGGLSGAGAGPQPLLWGLAALPALALPVVWFLVPESSVRAPGGIDWSGVALLSLGLTLLLGALGGGAPIGAAVALFAVGALLLALFVRQELRSTRPMVDVRLLARRATAPVFALSFLLGCALYGAQGPMLTFEAATRADDGYGLGVSTLGLGLLALPPTLGAMAGAITADRLARRFGFRPILTLAFAVCTLGYGSVALAHGVAWQIAVPGAVSGYGAGIGLSLLPSLLMRRMPADRTGIGTGIYNTLKSLAGAFAGAGAAALLDHWVLRHGVPTEGAYVAVWTCCALLCALGVPVALALRGEGPAALSAAEPLATGTAAARP
ncbi:MFS transporter [Streptacidiphilus sp. P02-A3a]|uniref:MFS transporter n=1 Tax=Streptacidiphilus sp. P02-A3a TaxID=2704468 RepID=UPI0015FAEA9E|nr:MFS transporter [Streptacidiphilus sp. P02-A3a]QMU67063.1 MFS transporter [Streptacidiphilus sp. P02-A3a]